MATYSQIQHWVKQQHGFTPKTCWIAHVMADHGLTKRAAPNRLNPKSRKYPCPHEKRAAIDMALRHFGMV